MDEKKPPRGFSVVIPAHDEASLLPLSLRALLGQRFEGMLDIVVVANGCTDDTVAVARSFITEAAERGHSLRVHELECAGKTRALNCGDEMKHFGTTMYLDADVVLSETALCSLHQVLCEDHSVLLASPRLVIAPSRSAITRAYGRVWSRLPYIERRVRGVGCYAVNARGRARWGRYPDLLADDHFARLHFRPDEQRMVEDAHYVWPLPEGFGELIRVRSRWLLGNHDLRRSHPDLTSNDDKRYAGMSQFILRNPSLWMDAAVFVGVYALALGRMYVKRWQGDRSWTRAEQARVTRLAVNAADGT